MSETTEKYEKKCYFAIKNKVDDVTADRGGGKKFQKPFEKMRH